MNIPKMIAELQAEKQRLDEAILALERLAIGNKTKRRVKPRSGPAGTGEPDAEPPKTRSQSSG